MGGGPDTKPEHLLVILPFEEPTMLIARIKKRFPYIKVTYENLNFESNFEDGVREISKGRFLLQAYLTFIESTD